VIKCNKWGRFREGNMFEIISILFIVIILIEILSCKLINNILDLWWNYKVCLTWTREKG